METVKQIEKILGVKLEEKRYGKLYDPKQKNTYSISGEDVSRLELDDIIIDDFSKLLPYLKELRTLILKNSSIPNFSELLALNCLDLFLDNVVFNNTNCPTKGKLPVHLKFSNMKLDGASLSCFKLSNLKCFRQVEFSNCHIDNIQHINDIKPISLLIFNKITFTHKCHEKVDNSSTRRLTIYNSKFEDVSFLPFKDSLADIEFVNCKIGSISQLIEFPNLKEIAIDSNTTIKDQLVKKKTSNKKLLCVLSQGESPLDLKRIRSIKKSIHKLELSGFKAKTIDFIQEFKQIKHLSFRYSKVYVDAFLPIAKQIESIAFRDSKIKNHAHFEAFENLIKFELNYYDEGNKGLGSFEKILPLKKQLKVLEIFDFQKIKAPHLVKEFKVLECLKISCKIPVKTAKHILSLENLKQLSLSVAYKKKCTLSLRRLKKLEALILETEVKFIGFQYLKKLKALKLGADLTKSNIDINSMPKLKNLKRLNVRDYSCKINGLRQFPNLEYLKVGCPKLKLGKLKKLKVLDLQDSVIRGFSNFKELPNLEKLDLSYLDDRISLEELYKFPNLKSLTFLESDISDISYLEPLKKLEYLDLCATEVSDVRILNTLPHLKEVNIATSSNANLEAQLDKPEIAIYCGFHPIHFCIWEEDAFGI